MFDRCVQVAHRAIIALLAAAAPFSATGCAHHEPINHQALFMTPTMSPDSVVVDLFFVRFPYGETEINALMWDEIDEQRLAPEIRTRLARNGFRAGVISGSIPAALRSRLDAEPMVEQPEEGVAVELRREPSVRRSHWQVRAAERRPILASGIYDELPLIYASHGADGGVGGRPYQRAQCLFAVKTYPQGTNRARFEILPEIEYGEPKNNWVANDTGFRLEPRRDNVDFDELHLGAELEAGEMLVLGCLPDRSGSLGHYFFTDEISGALEQKLIILRLAQTQYDDAFAAAP